jgi:hypothetical protein
MRKPSLVLSAVASISIVFFMVSPAVCGTAITISPSTLGPATVGQPFHSNITASGGAFNTYLWAVNGVSVPTDGSPLALTDGFTASPTSGSDFGIAGTPTAATAPGVPLKFTVTVQNAQCIECGGDGQSGTVTYLINVENPSYTVSGQINLNNSCGGNQALPPITVAINTSPARTTITNSNGQFSFSNVPNGTYTITPSIKGASSIFYPASQSVTVKNSGANTGFSVALGYTVSGTVDYSGAKTGWIYLAMNGGCGGFSGTAIPEKGLFTIRGVPPGSYNLQAWMDNVGFESPNATNPVGSSPVTISTGNKSNVTVKLTDPAAVKLTSAPKIQMVDTFTDGAVVGHGIIQNNNFVEVATSYTLEWSTSATFTKIAGSHNFAATGPNSNNVWIVNGSSISGLTNGDTYYFRARGVAGSSDSPWSKVYGPVTIGAPKATNTVSGKVSFTGTATGPLYVGFVDMNSNNVYVTTVRDPVSPQYYSVEVPDGSAYYFFGIIDQNNDGLIDACDIQNTNENLSAVTIKASKTNYNLTLPSADSLVTLTTQYNRMTNQYGTNNNYTLNFNVNGLIKLPVAVVLVSGPNVIAPLDIGQCNCNNNGGFSFWPSLGSTAPKVGDTYTIKVTYSDQSSQNLTAKVNAVMNALATNLSPTGTGASRTPTFTWTDPASASSYIYSFNLWDNSGNYIWRIPGNNSASRGFSSAIKKVVWGTDPTGANNPPSVTGLTEKVSYNWAIQATDVNGNSAQMQVNYEPK